MTLRNKILVKFTMDCGRMGVIDGLFICTDTELANVLGKEVDFGEALGKHSDISGCMSPEMFTIVSTNIRLIGLLLSTFDTETLCGYNPVLISSG